MEVEQHQKFNKFALIFKSTDFLRCLLMEDHIAC